MTPLDLKEKVNKFIEDHIDLIDENNFKEFYNILDDTENSGDLYYNVGVITDILYEAGIDPLKGSIEVYPNMFVHSEKHHIEIPNTIRSLGTSAFYCAFNLENFIIPRGVTKIPFECFEECYNLDWIEVPDTVVHIDPDAFSYDHVFVMKCVQGSYADKWADDHGLKVEYI